MADDTTNPNSDAGEQAAPTPDSAQAQSGAPANSNAPDPVAMAKELGETKAKLEAAAARVNQLEPVIDTLYSDQELLRKATDIHNKRLGISPSDDIPNPQAEANLPAKPSPTEIDNRNALTAQIVKDFYAKHGADKLEAEAKKELDQRVGVQLGEMLDPGGNKTLQQIFDTVSLTKLPQYLDNAYKLATMNEKLEEAKTQGKQEAAQETLGVIGSIPSSSPSVEQTVLTPQQKKAADGLGIAHDKYLQRVKEIAARDNPFH